MPAGGVAALAEVSLGDLPKLGGCAGGYASPGDGLATFVEVGLGDFPKLGGCTGGWCRRRCRCRCQARVGVFPNRKKRALRWGDGGAGADGRAATCELCDTSHEALVHHEGRLEALVAALSQKMNRVGDERLRTLRAAM